MAVADKMTNSSVFTKELRLPIGNDVISRIAMSGKPEIISEINPAAEVDVVPYYEAPGGVKSLIGVPIFYRDDVIAVLAADSLTDEGFGRETVPLLGNFTRLFSDNIASLNRQVRSRCNQDDFQFTKVADKRINIEKRSGFYSNDFGNCGFRHGRCRIRGAHYIRRIILCRVIFISPVCQLHHGQCRMW